MVAALDGIIFHQFYGDNSGGSEFDTDGDGTATQEDEFVSFQNTTGAPVDISGWQIWSDMTGTGAPDGMQDGLYHTFPPGSVIDPGRQLYVVNEYTGTPPPYIQEASEGGLESGAGGVNTNFLSEGANSAAQPESVALVNPVTGDYIILNFSATQASNIPALTGFPGTTSVGESNAATDSGEEDQDAGSAYVYNSVTDSYDYGAVSVTCFAAGTRIAVPGAERPVEEIAVGDLVETLDHGPLPVRKILKRQLDFSNPAHGCHRPVLFEPGSLGPGLPRRRLLVSPQHRMLVAFAGRAGMLVPAKGLVARPGVRRARGLAGVDYVHLVFERHEIVRAEGCWSESFYPGAATLSRLDVWTRAELGAIFPELEVGAPVAMARRTATVTQTRGRARRMIGFRV